VGVPPPPLNSAKIRHHSHRGHASALLTTPSEMDISMATTQALYRQQLALIRQQLAGMKYQAEEVCRLGVGFR